MISVEAALADLFALVRPLAVETVPLAQAAGRVLAQDLSARRSQPPFAASAMDGYAVIGAEIHPGAQFTVIGEAAAGHRYDGHVGPGQAVRIFTGAPVPTGADFVVLQEDVARDGSQITLTGNIGSNGNIRAAGGDFNQGDIISAPRLLTASDVALLASMNFAEVPVTRRPNIALISTGDELVMPGETPGPDQIIASNTFGLKAQLEAAGAKARILPIARDTKTSLKLAFDLARDADLIVTIGGASVGDHDLVAPVAEELGMQRAFYKVAMRPGKPLMAGRLDNAMMVGLPGNPVSAMVCGAVFLIPVVRAMLGLPALAAQLHTAPLAFDLEVNGPRQHYMRAVLAEGALQVFDNQDSAMLSVLSQANALVLRPIGDPARSAGDSVNYIAL